MKEYESIVQRNPQSDVAANNFAMLLVTYGKDAASLDRAKSLASRFADSANPSYLDTYGWVLFNMAMRRVGTGVTAGRFRRSQSAVVLYHLGMAQSQSGHVAQALDNLTRAVNSGAKFSGLDEARATLDKLNSAGNSKHKSLPVTESSWRFFTLSRRSSFKNLTVLGDLDDFDAREGVHRA